MDHRAVISSARDRLSELLGGGCELTVDWPGEASPASALASALDRVLGAVEWLSSWRGAERALRASVAGIHVAASSPGSQGGPLAHGDASAGRFVFVSGPGGEFPGANACARCFDETLSLYEARVADVRESVLPREGARLAQLLPGAELVLDLDNFARLDWEGDDYYNAYAELSPAAAPQFLGRVARAIGELLASGSAEDAAKIRAAVTRVKFKLSVKPHKRIRLRRGTLKLSERFWLGPEHSEAEIRACVESTLGLGTAARAVMTELSSRLVPMWEDRIATLLGRAEPPSRRVPIQIVWDTVRSAPDVRAAALALAVDESRLCLARVHDAIADLASRSPSALGRLSTRLAAIRVRVAPEGSSGTGARCKSGVTREAMVAHLAKHPQPPLTAGRAPVVHEGDVVLKIKGSWGAASGEAEDGGAVPASEIRAALAEAVPLDEDDTFHVSYIKQTAEHAEVHGRISDFSKFVSVFRSMEEYQRRARAGFKDLPPHVATGGSHRVSAPPASAGNGANVVGPAQQPPFVSAPAPFALSVAHHAPTSANSSPGNDHHGKMNHANQPDSLHQLPQHTPFELLHHHHNHHNHHNHNNNKHNHHGHGYTADPVATVGQIFGGIAPNNGAQPQQQQSRGGSAEPVAAPARHQPVWGGSGGGGGGGGGDAHLAGIDARASLGGRSSLGARSSLGGGGPAQAHGHFPQAQQRPAVMHQHLPPNSHPNSHPHQVAQHIHHPAGVAATVAPADTLTGIPTGARVINQWTRDARLPAGRRERGHRRV